MELHPDGVVRVAGRRREPLALPAPESRARASSRRPAYPPNRGIAGTSPSRIRPAAACTSRSRLDHAVVVAGVGVVVGDAAPGDLPVVADLEQAGVHRLESGVGGVGGDRRRAPWRRGRPRRVRASRPSGVSRTRPLSTTTRPATRGARPTPGRQRGGSPASAAGGAVPTGCRAAPAKARTDPAGRRRCGPWTRCIRYPKRRAPPHRRPGGTR